MDDAMLGQVLSLLESLVTSWALKRLLPCVDAAMSLELRGIFKAPLTVRALHWFLAGGITVMLDEIGRRLKTSTTQGAFERLLGAVGVLVALKGG